MVHHLNTNKQFMTGSFMLAFAVIVIVVVFLYMSMRSDWDPSKPKTYSEQFEICLSKGFSNDSITVMMGDSVIFHGFVSSEPMVIQVQRFEANTSLMFVNPETETVSIVNLDENGGLFNIVNENGVIKVAP